MTTQVSFPARDRSGTPAGVYLPDDLLAQILGNLQIQELCQPRRVCKQWKRVVDATSVPQSSALQAPAAVGHTLRQAMQRHVAQQLEREESVEEIRDDFLEDLVDAISKPFAGVFVGYLAGTMGFALGVSGILGAPASLAWGAAGGFQAVAYAAALLQRGQATAAWNALSRGVDQARRCARVTAVCVGCVATGAVLISVCPPCAVLGTLAYTATRPIPLATKVTSRLWEARARRQALTLAAQSLQGHDPDF